jgi:hypothetical protein
MHSKIRKLIIILLFTLILLLLNVCISFSKTQVINVTPNTTTIGQYEKFEIRFTVNTTYTNPYNPDEADITVYFTPTDSTTMQVIPAFWYQGYTAITGSFENYTPVGSPTWMARFAPRQYGSYTYFIRIADSQGVSTSGTYTFTCSRSDKPGFLYRNPTNQKYLQFEKGQTYLPVGHDIGWDNGSGTLFFNKYYTKMGQYQENWTRLWLASFCRLTLEWSSTDWSGVYQGLGKYAQIPAWRLDYALELARQKGIYVQLTLLHHGMFSSSVNAQWEDNPYNTTNQGFLSSPAHFFTNSTAKNLYKKQLRYIIARWGYNTNVLAWELWNEVQFTDDFGSSTVQQINVANWHQGMAQYIKQIDPFQHLITTSSDGNGFQYFWPKPELDIIQVHYYGDGREQIIHNQVTTLRAIYNKPVWFGEFGTGVYGTGEALDSTGIYLHNGIWAGALSESIAASWWWDDPIERHNLYYHFLGLAKYLDDENFAGYNLSYANFSISSGTQDTTGLKAYPGLGWDSSQQTEFYVQPDGTIPGIEKLASFIQGYWHREMGRQAIFHITSQISGKFGIYISNYSSIENGPYAVSTLVIYVDNTTTPVYTQQVNTTGLVTVSLSSGTHLVKVYNSGLDWFTAPYYQFTGFGLPAVEGFGLATTTRAYFWLHDRASQPDYPLGNGTITGTNLLVNHLQDGTYTVTWYNTTSSGKISLTIPAFQKDIALKLRFGTTDTEILPDY